MRHFLNAGIAVNPFLRTYAFLLLCGLCGAFDAAAADNTDVTGRWELTTTSPSGSYVAGIDLAVDQDKYVSTPK